jgi:hypothetical protein
VLFAPRQTLPLLVFAASDAMRVTVRPTLVYADGRRAPIPKSWATVARGGAWAFRVRTSGAQQVVLAISVRDGAGAVHRATRAIAAG